MSRTSLAIRADRTEETTVGWVSWDADAVAGFADGGPTQPGSSDACGCAFEAAMLAVDRRVDRRSVPLHGRTRDETANITALPWQPADVDRSVGFAERFGPLRELLIRHVDTGVSPAFQPGIRMQSAP